MISSAALNVRAELSTDPLIFFCLNWLKYEPTAQVCLNILYLVVSQRGSKKPVFL